MYNLGLFPFGHTVSLFLYTDSSDVVVVCSFGPVILIWNEQKWENFYITCVLFLDAGSGKSFAQASSHLLATKIKEILEKNPQDETKKKKKSLQPSATQFLPHPYF